MVMATARNQPDDDLIRYGDEVIAEMLRRGHLEVAESEPAVDGRIRVTLALTSEGFDHVAEYLHAT